MPEFTASKKVEKMHHHPINGTLYILSYIDHKSIAFLNYFVYFFFIFPRYFDD